MRSKPLVWTLVFALAGLGVAVSACAPAPLPENLQRKGAEQSSVAQTTTAVGSGEQATPGTAEETTSEAGTTSQPKAEGSAAVGGFDDQVGSTAKTSGGGVGGDIFRTGFTAAGAVAFSGGDGKAVAPCVQCHGSDGSGGTGPDIRGAALAKAGYKADMVSRAIRDGIDQKGKPLGKAMPHFKIGNADMQSLIAFLNSLK